MPGRCCLAGELREVVDRRCDVSSLTLTLPNHVILIKRRSSGAGIVAGDPGYEPNRSVTLIVTLTPRPPRPTGPGQKRTGVAQVYRVGVAVVGVFIDRRRNEPIVWRRVPR